MKRGLIDQNFLDMPNPLESFTRFWEIIRGMGLDDTLAKYIHLDESGEGNQAMEDPMT